MIVIFLSGEPINTGGQLYLKNILNTLFLPKGSFNRYRYASSGQHVNIGSETVNNLRRWWRRFGTTRIVFMFVDRYQAGGYRYVPLRHAVLKRFRQEGSQVFITVELGEYVTTDDSTAEQFLQQAAKGTGFPQLTNGDPNHRGDGNYIVISSGTSSDFSGWIHGIKAWEDAVDRLSSAQRFQKPSGTLFIFLRASVEGSWGRTIRPGRAGRIRTRLDHTFGLRIGHRWSFPLPVPNLRLKLQGENAVTFSPSLIEIANRADVQEIRVKTGKYSDDSYLDVGLQPETPTGPAALLPNSPISFRLGMSVQRLLKVALLILAVAVATVAAATPYDFSQPFVWKNFVASIPWLKVLFEIIKLGAAMGLFILFGKKLT